ncbi:MAG: mandelate racemase/muconate lactonizing enzyme family protein, partial [Candidatus Latescibacteria bacterium]|nr:mandelate racemase/muconate lactonizing enzyme family protein [Candidatus Latescibacterota bacterium]
MKIASIQAVTVDLPPVRPKTKARRPSWRESSPIGLPMNKYPEFPPGLPHKSPGFGGRAVWVKVTAEDGTWGIGRTGFGEPVAALVDFFYGPLLKDRDCFATEFLNDMMWTASKRHGSVGMAAFAQSAIDLALWDLKGKLLQQPVYRLLGGPSRDKIKCYCTSDDLDWSIELGFEAFKITNPVHYSQGLEGVGIMEEKVANARETIGKNAELMINPVMAYDVEFAIRLAERLRPYELRWMEEPLPPEDLESHIQLRKAIPYMPIATG